MNADRVQGTPIFLRINGMIFKHTTHLLQTACYSFLFFFKKKKPRQRWQREQRDRTRNLEGEDGLCSSITIQKNALLRSSPSSNTNILFLTTSVSLLVLTTRWCLFLCRTFFGIFHIQCVWPQKDFFVRPFVWQKFHSHGTTTSQSVMSVSVIDICCASRKQLLYDRKVKTVLNHFFPGRICGFTVKRDRGVGHETRYTKY
jgi:hypothetical protein